jgi:hypothetical protein
MPIRRKVLHAYYEATFGRGAAAVERHPRVFADATFDEYLALKRTEYPTLSARDAAVLAPRADFRALAKTLPVELLPDEPHFTYGELTGAKVDARLRLPAGVDAIRMKGVKSLRTFGGLARIARLRRIVARTSAATFAPPQARVEVEELDVSSCRPEFVASLFGATRAQRVEWIEWGAEPIDLAHLAGHVGLTTLHAHGAWIRNAHALPARRLAELALGRVRIDARLAEVLRAAGRTLRSLELVSNDDLAPTDLPFKAMRALERVKLCVHATHRDAWIALALARPEIRFDFGGPPPPRPALPEIELAEVHRAIDLLRVTRGTKLSYRIESDVADAVGYAASNGALEDELAKRARVGKRKIDWGSEADTLVATARDLETCRWVIDEACAIAAEAPRARTRKRG